MNDYKKKTNKFNRQIADFLWKAPQTIHNEIKRGTILKEVRKGLYKRFIRLIMLKLFTKPIEGNQ